MPVSRTSNSTDNNGEPKKIYIFGPGSLTSQVELSRTQIILGWTAATDSDDAIKKAIKNVKVAQRLARAMLGIEGGQLVDRLMSGYIMREDAVIDGYRVSTATCVNNWICLIKINR